MLSNLFKKKKVLIRRAHRDMTRPMPEEVRGWLDMGVGRYHLNQLRNRLNECMDNWANNLYTGNTPEETLQMNAKALGEVQTLADIISTLEEMTKDEPDEDTTDNDDFTY